MTRRSEVINWAKGLADRGMGWYEKGVLLEEDLAELQAKIDEKNTPIEEVEEVEEVTEEGELNDN